MAFTKEFSIGWAWLPRNLLDSILDNMVTISDYVRFSVVCKPWYSVAIHHPKYQRLDIIHDKVPLLVLPPNFPASSSSPEGMRSLYSVTENKVYNFKIPFSYNKRICGSSHGWLFTVEENMTLVLINPFSGGTIRLPPIRTIPDIEFEEVDGYEVVKASLTADPILFPNDYTVIAICGGTNTLAYIKSGDKSWSYVNTPYHHWLTDFVSYKGLIYAVDIWGMVLSFDISGVEDSYSSSPSSRIKVVAPSMSVMSDVTYIVESSAGDHESSAGDLMLVQRFVVPASYCDSLFLSSSFRIFKMQFGPNGDVVERVELESLGGDALFLADNFSAAVLASDFVGCRSNSIYFSDHNYSMIEHSPYFMSHDFWIFNFGDCSIEKLCKLHPSPKHMMLGTWILSTLQGFPSSSE